MAEFETIRTGTGARTAAIDEGLRAHMNKVYATMSIGMLLTFAAAWAVGNNAAMMETLFTGFTRYIVMFAPLIMVFAFGAVINKLSAAAAQFFFYAFSVVMGVSISYIFVVFTDFSIAQIFLVTSIAFAGLSLWGYTTKKDISGWGSFLIMGVIGLIVANMAVCAASEDPRFSPLRMNEVPVADIELSILGKLEKMGADYQL